MAIGDVRYSHFDAQKHETNKKRPERRKHCVPDAVPDRRTESATAVVKQSQNSPPRRRPPSQGRRTDKIQSAGDGHYLHLQTQFGDDGCTQFRVIVVTDTARPPAGQPQTQKHTDRTDYNTLRR